MKFSLFSKAAVLLLASSAVSGSNLRGERVLATCTDDDAAFDAIIAETMGWEAGSRTCAAYAEKWGFLEGGIRADPAVYATNGACCATASAITAASTCPASTRIEINEFDTVVAPLRVETHDDGRQYVTSTDAMDASTGYVEFQLQVNKDGPVVLAGLGASSACYSTSRNGNTDSFYVSVDGGEEAIWTGFAGQCFNSYVNLPGSTDCAVSSGCGSSNGEYTLTKGLHTFKFRMRENGASLMSVKVLSGDASFCVSHQIGGPICNQDPKLAFYHESVSKLGSFTSADAAWEAASASCASRGKYLCSASQNEEQCNAQKNYDQSTFLAVSDPEGSQQKKYVDVGPSGDRVTLTSVTGFSSATTLFSCCGNEYPGESAAQTAHLIAVNVAEEDDDEPQYVFVSESYMVELMNGYTLEASATVGADTGTELGCAWEDGEYFCGAAAEAEMRATLRAEISGTVATVGGVPVVGTVYYEATVGVTAGATAGITGEGVVVGATVGVDASVTYGVEFVGEVAPGVELSTGVAVEAGGSAEATAEATITLSEVSADFEAGVEFGVGIEVEQGVSTDVGEASASAGACVGCAGVGLSPSFSVDGCDVTIGVEGSASLLVGVSAGFEAGIDTCYLGGAIAGAAMEVADWGDDLANDVADGVVDAAQAVAAVTVDAANIVADGVVDAANEVADWTEGAVNDAVDWTEGAANDVADTATDAAEATVDFAEDAGNAIAKTFRRF